ncbi:hypothetical protein Acr_28g0005480 [Actinidia rufa]|uniref:Uncharacterized protein n=1 Tax=Actinidia rufa TaxID=165716 RepID=A0A7J0H9P9_9ERIC|nr:hypothetical protein Acr_28g0005480 [Actinidia rufa]
MSDNVNITDLDNIFPSWILDHLGERSYIDTEFKKFAISLNEFKHLFGHFNNPRPDSGWLYFKPRPKRTLIGGYPNNVKGWKKKFFFISGDNLEVAHGLSQELEVSRVLRSWSTPVAGTMLKRNLRAMWLTLRPMRVSPTFPEKGKQATNAKNKRSMLSPEGASCQAPAKPKATSTRATTQDAPTFAATREGISANLGVVLGLEASAMDNPVVTEKLLQGFILLVDKETMSKLDLNMATTREMREEAMTQQANASSFRDEMTCAQKVAKDLEGRYKEVMDGAASSYFGKCFDLCKKQIGILHPNLDNLDLQIDLDLVDEDKEEEKDVPNTNPP